MPLYASWYKQEDGYKNVNIFHRHSSCVILLLLRRYKTYCFAFQKRRFCTVKAAVLHRKTAAFAMPKRSYHFLRELFLQNGRCFRIRHKRRKGTVLL